jgi:hypothetical protein
LAPRRTICIGQLKMRASSGRPATGFLFKPVPQLVDDALKLFRLVPRLVFSGGPSEAFFSLRFHTNHRTPLRTIVLGSLNQTAS